MAIFGDVERLLAMTTGRAKTAGGEARDGEVVVSLADGAVKDHRTILHKQGHRRGAGF
jgi:hypothetical protein